MIGYALLAIYPQVVFSHKATFANYTLHARRPLSPEAIQVLERANRLLRESAVFSDRNHHRIFLCNSKGWFSFFLLRPGARLFAFTPATRNIFVQHAEPGRDLAWKSSNTNLTRSLSGLTAHEVTHNHLRERPGWIGAERLPKWNHEGYAEYVSMNGQEDYERGMVKGLGADVEGGYSHPTYRGFLSRVVEAMGGHE